jgi:hypothetical protein
MEKSLRRRDNEIPYIRPSTRSRFYRDEVLIRGSRWEARTGWHFRREKFTLIFIGESNVVLSACILGHPVYRALTIDARLIELRSPRSLAGQLRPANARPYWQGESSRSLKISRFYEDKSLKESFESVVSFRMIILGILYLIAISLSKRLH